MKELSTKADINLHLVYQPIEKNAPYSDFDLDFCRKVFQYSKSDSESIKNYCYTLSPDIIIMSSWNYTFYKSIAKSCRKRGTYVIATFDGQWRNTLKQNLGILSSPFYLKPYIDNFFVPGDRQATFSRKLGYKTPLIGYYTANSTLFGKNHPPITSRRKSFLFIGRLVEVKGILTLLEAYSKYRSSSSSPWDLTILGKGKLESLCRNIEGVHIEGFKQPNELHAYFTSNSCFILPSSLEPWGLVIHEAAFCGLPIIASFECGATTYFLRDGLNGYLIDSNVDSLLKAMQKVSSLDNQQLMSMSQISITLANLWTTPKWAEYVYKSIKTLVRPSHFLDISKIEKLG